MTQGGDMDYFAVAAKTTDTRIYQIVYNQGSLKAVRIIDGNIIYSWRE